jgi:competence protein ComEC
LDVTRSLRQAHALAVSFAAYALGVIAVADGFALLVAAIAALTAFVIPSALRRETSIRWLGALAGIAATLGAASAALALHRDADVPYAVLAEHHIVVEAIALERPRATGGGDSMRIRIVRVVEPIVPAARSLEGEAALLDFPARRSVAGLAGKSLRVRARLSLPAGTRNDGEPAERDILAEQGVAVILAAPSDRDVTVGRNASGTEAWWARLRANGAEALESRLPALEATVLEGILWGDRGNLSAALRQEFSDTGTVHVLTTAGLHLGIFAAIVGGLLSWLPLPRLVRVSLVVCSAWLYAALAGMHLPTMRAATMLTAGCIAQESGRGRSPSAVLAAAAFAVALPHPLVLLTPSFSMSFACVCGIALISPALERVGLREASGIPRFLAELVRTSLAVQIAMWPLQALYFNAFTPYAVLANMIVVPLVGIAMALGGTLLFASALLPVAAWPAGNLAWCCVTLLVGAVEKFASLPMAHIDLPPPTHAFLICYWVALGVFAWATYEPQRMRSIGRWVAPAIVVLGLAYCAPGLGAAFDSRLHVDAIDVGQADCFLIRAPGMHAMLVDGGGKLERSGANGTVVAQPLGDIIATRTVMPFLLRHWVLHLDAVVLTHPHGDHAGGLPVILERERVGALWDSAQLYGGPAYRRALEVVRERHIAWRKALRGESFELGPTTHVKILAPELPLLTGTASDINNNSVVLRVQFGHVAILMTGDAQSEAEARLLSHGGSDLRADILKVGHHGSAYSSTPAFLAAVHPKIAIISCGLHNVFGHPSPRTLAALHAVGALIYRTDVDGGISIMTNGENFVATASGIR